MQQNQNDLNRQNQTLQAAGSGLGDFFSSSSGQGLLNSIGLGQSGIGKSGVQTNIAGSNQGGSGMVSTLAQLAPLLAMFA